eukprot:m51a1_g10978 hypothetical protein (462) ;mRNA; f:287952-290390
MDQLRRVYSRLAKSEVGVIVVSQAFVSPDGRVLRNQIGAHSDAMLGGLTRLAHAVHNADSRCIVGVQLNHGGRLRSCMVMGELEMTRVEMDFAAAAKRVRAAGFDMVQLQMGHGYLLHQFLSPLWNDRADKYGGSLDNRLRFPLRILSAIAVKMNTNDNMYRPDGISLQESTCIAAALAAAGVQMLEASKAFESYNDFGAALWKEALHASSLIEQGKCDIVALGRPLLRDPELVLKWMHDPEARSDCASCCLCLLRKIEEDTRKKLAAVELKEQELAKAKEDRVNSKRLRQQREEEAFKRLQMAYKVYAPTKEPTSPTQTRIRKVAEEKRQPAILCSASAAETRTALPEWSHCAPTVMVDLAAETSVKITAHGQVLGTADARLDLGILVDGRVAGVTGVPGMGSSQCPFWTTAVSVGVVRLPEGQHAINVCVRNGSDNGEEVAARNVSSVVELKEGAIHLA